MQGRRVDAHACTDGHAACLAVGHSRTQGRPGTCTQHSGAVCAPRAATPHTRQLPAPCQPLPLHVGRLALHMHRVESPFPSQHTSLTALGGMSAGLVPARSSAWAGCAGPPRGKAPVEWAGAAALTGPSLGAPVQALLMQTDGRSGIGRRQQEVCRGSSRRCGVLRVLRLRIEPAHAAASARQPAAMATRPVPGTPLAIMSPATNSDSRRPLRKDLTRRNRRLIRACMRSSWPLRPREGLGLWGSGSSKRATAWRTHTGSAKHSSVIQNKYPAGQSLGYLSPCAATPTEHFLLIHVGGDLKTAATSPTPPASWTSPAVR